MPNNQKIKSIEYRGLTLPLSIINPELIQILESDSVERSAIESYSDFRILYEEPTPLYNSNNSLFDKPEQGQTVWIVTYDRHYKSWIAKELEYDIGYEEYLVEEKVFDDRNEAEAEAERVGEYWRIKDKLKGINFENPDSVRCYKVYWQDSLDRAGYKLVPSRNDVDFRLCEEAKDYFMELPKEEQKAFLKK